VKRAEKGREFFRISKARRVGKGKKEGAGKLSPRCHDIKKKKKKGGEEAVNSAASPPTVNICRAAKKEKKGERRGKLVGQATLDRTKEKHRHTSMLAEKGKEGPAPIP